MDSQHKPAPRAQTGAALRAPGHTRRQAAAAALVLLVAGSVHAQAGPDQWAQPDEGTYPVAPAAAELHGAGDLTVHATRADLLAAAGAVVLLEEDFSGGFISGPDIGVCFQAVGSRSDDPCFAPGDLVPGFALRSSRGSIFDANSFDSDLVVLGSGVIGTAGNVVGANISDPPWNPTHISFDPPRTLVGFDAYDGMAGGIVQVRAYDADEVLIGSFQVDPPLTNEAAFAGFSSTRPVRRVEVNALENGGSELIGALVFGGTAGIATSSPAALAFGAVAVGSTAQAQVALTNHGQLPLQLGDAQPPAAGFALVEDACSATTLAPAQQCLLSYGFTPDYPGAFEAVAVLPDGTTLPLSGVGVQAWLATAPGYVQFPAVAVGEDATTGLALRNPGTAVQVVTGLASSSAAFSTAPGSCGELPVALQPGQECVLEVVFAPQHAGRVDATLTIAADGAVLARASLGGTATSAIAGAH